MMEHTSEPWVIGSANGTVSGELTIIGGGKGKTGKPYALAGVFRFDETECDRKEAEANSSRIVDCVNACAGMEDPAAELAALRKRIGDLEKAWDIENDNLNKMAHAVASERAKVQMLRTALVRMVNCYGGSRRFPETMILAREALSATEPRSYGTSDPCPSCAESIDGKPGNGACQQCIEERENA